MSGLTSAHVDSDGGVRWASPYLRCRVCGDGPVSISDRVRDGVLERRATCYGCGQRKTYRRGTRELAHAT